MSNDYLKITRELTEHFTFKYPNTCVMCESFEAALKGFFEEETRHGTVYYPVGCEGMLCINPAAFTKAIALLYSGMGNGIAKTITAEIFKKNFVLTITVDGDLPPRSELAVISRIMHMAGFEFTCDEHTVQLVTKFTNRQTLSLYNDEVNNLRQLLHLEFILVNNTLH